MSAEHFSQNHSHDALVKNTAHEIEQRYQSGENLPHVLKDEIRHLRNSEYSQGHFRGQSFKHDLKQLEHRLQADHILPHIHINTSGKHAGSFEAIGRAPQHKPGHDDKPGHKGPAPLAAAAPREVPLSPHRPRPVAHGDQSRPSEGVAELPKRPNPGALTDHARPADGARLSGPDAGDAAAGASQIGQTGSGELDHLKQVIDKAKATGHPINMVQIGDSHIAAGIETKALANGLSNRFGIKVNYQADGINGAHTTDALKNEGFFLKDLNKDTNLVVVSFGSNDADSKAGQAYRQNYEKLLSDIKAKAPNATLVMVGPTDGAYWHQPDKQLVGLDSVTAEQRAVAANVPNSSYFDIRAKLGTIAQMRSHGWMDDSNLHFTNDGYNVIGDSIAQFIKNKTK